MDNDRRNGILSHCPIIILAFNRPDYLRSVLNSLVGQAGVNLQNYPIYLFQDGAVNPYSGKRYADDQEIETNVLLFKEIIPHGEVVQSDVNLGVALNFDRAEQFAFEILSADAAVFLEDDLWLGKFYLKTLEKLIDNALSDERVGYVAAYGDHKLSLEQQMALPNGLTVQGHNWAFGLTRRQWLRQRPYVEEYLDIVRNSDYRGRNHDRIAELFHKWGLGVPGTSQDIAKSHACVLTKTAKLSTRACFGRYIGKEGLHFNEKIFENMGFGETPVIEEDVFSLEYFPNEDVNNSLRILEISARNEFSKQDLAALLDDQNSTAQDLLSQAIRLRQDRFFAESLQIFEEGQRRYPKFNDAYSHPAFLKEKLRTLLMLRDWERAEATSLLVKDHISENDACVEVLFARAKAAAGDLKSARAIWTKVVGIEPRNTEARAFLDKHEA